jgi:hypothetical protein
VVFQEMVILSHPANIDHAVGPVIVSFHIIGQLESFVMVILELVELFILKALSLDITVIS